MKPIRVAALLISVAVFSSINAMAVKQDINYEVKKIDCHYAPANGGGVCTVYYSMLPYFTFLQVGGPNVFSGEYEYELGVDVQYKIPQDKLLDKDAILEIVNN